MKKKNTVFKSVDMTEKNCLNATHEVVSDEISKIRDGISQGNLHKNSSSKEKIHEKTPCIKPPNDAYTGNSKMTEPMKTIEPVTTFFEDGKVLRILTELPGIAEEKIRIDLDSSSTLLTIVASDTERQYKKVINIPSEVKFNYKRFSDGVLELTLGKNNPDTLFSSVKNSPRF